MRMTEKEGVELLQHSDPITLGRLADAERLRRYGNTTTFIVDRNINYTNVCVNECRFCAFFRRRMRQKTCLLYSKTEKRQPE